MRCPAVSWCNLPLALLRPSSPSPAPAAHPTTRNDNTWTRDGNTNNTNYWYNNTERQHNNTDHKQSTLSTNTPTRFPGMPALTQHCTTKWQYGVPPQQLLHILFGVIVVQPHHTGPPHSILFFLLTRNLFVIRFVQFCLEQRLFPLRSVHYSMTKCTIFKILCKNEAILPNLLTLDRNLIQKPKWTMLTSNDNCIICITYIVCER